MKLHKILFLAIAIVLVKIDFAKAQTSEVKSEIAKLDKKRTYLVYCKAGVRSGNAASIMKAAGFSHLYSLDGGIDAWQDAGKTIEK